MKHASGGSSQPAGDGFSANDYQAIFESSPDLYLVLDPGLRIIAVNDAYARGTMTRREDIIGKGIFEVFPDNPGDPATEGVRNLRISLQRVIQTGMPDAMLVQKYDIRRPDSEGGGFEERYWSPINTPVFGPDGRLAYIIHRVEDVTEFIRLKQQGVEQGRLNESLRERAVKMEAEIFARAREVSEASALLKSANEELERLYRKTKELDEIKTRFFANVSHELRTPLTLILGTVARLLETPSLGAEDHARLVVVQRNGRLLHRQVDNLLDVAKLEAGRMDIRYSASDLSHLVRVLASNFESLAAERRIRYLIAAPQTLPAQVDGEKFQRILLNLLSNAFKFTPEGGDISVTLSGADGWATLEVADDGPGIPEAQREAVFERFRQGDEGSERRVGGTGLGLAIVKEFVSLHHGEVSVTQSAAGGALFRVSLPLLAPPGSVVAAEAVRFPDELPRPAVEDIPLGGDADLAADGEVSGPAGMPLILVVEDNVDMNAFIVSTLSSRYRVVKAFNGRAGLDLVYALRPDLIISDVMMPVMSGDRMVEEIRADRRFDDIPVIMLTAKADESLRVGMLRHGVQDYMQKPFSDNELLARIEALLVERRRVGGRLQSVEERFRATFEQAAVGFAHVAPNGRWLRVNQRLCDIVGYTRDELLLRTFQDITYPEDLDTDLAFMDKMLSGEAARYQMEKRYVRKDGSLVWINLTVALVKDDNGKPDYFISVVEDIQQRKEAEQALAHLAHYDPLTDLPNRLLLQSRLEHAIERAQRNGGRVAVLFIDLDRFKTVNDSMGHMVGDRLLVEVARRLDEKMGEACLLGRFGGDEFLLVLDPVADPESVAFVAQGLLDALSVPFRLSADNEVYVGASIGISIYPEDGASAEDLVRDADAAMYQAKEHGRNRFCFYTAAMNANAMAQLELEAALRRALERNELVLYYQAKVDLHTGQVQGAEALIRWQRGQVLEPPGRFISLAERTGIIVPIGAWVIDAACAQLRSWHDAGMGDMCVAVNVSGRQFYSSELPEVVAASLARHGVPASCLELEVTESMLMDDPERTIAILHNLKRIGVKLSLDDFGTGYSGFSYLSRFPIDTLKIDQSFVRDIVTEPEAAMIANSIIDLAHRMRLKVVAEGVETEPQLGYLRMRNCDEIQGYYFARPLPAEEFEALLNDGRSLPPTIATPDDRTLLLVDDEPNVISSLQRTLRREGYRILTASNGTAGLEILATHRVQVILSDQRMPTMTGTDFLRRVKELHPDTVRIVLSGYNDLKSITQAVNEGAIYKFLHKPWDDDLLREHIRDAFLYQEVVLSQKAGVAKPDAEITRGLP